MYKLSATYRQAKTSDLGAINRLIEMSVLNWALPKRLKRLAVPVMQYDEVDFDHLDLFVCVRGTEILGVSALDLDYAPSRGLLHGLFVLPIIQGHGIGKQLMQMGFDWAAANQLNTVVMRAERVSISYFQRWGFEQLTDLGPNGYPYQFEKRLHQAAPLALAS